jgi:hypothetical protein
MSDNAFFPIVQAVCNSHRWRLLGVMLSVLALGACALNPSTYFYSLSGLEAGASREPMAEATTKTYGIGPVFLPESLMQPGIVSEGDGQMLSVSLYPRCDRGGSCASWLSVLAATSMVRSISPRNGH